MESVTYKEREELEVSFLRGPHRFNICPQTHGRLRLLEWLQTALQRKATKIAASKTGCRMPNASRDNYN